MKKKKNLLFCLFLILSFSLIGCGKEQDKNNPLASVSLDIPNYTLVENVITTENMKTVEKTILNYNYGYVNENENAYYGYIGEQFNDAEWTNYYQILYKDGVNYYFHNNGWYKGEYENDFQIYNDSIKTFFTFENLKSLTKDENIVKVGEGKDENECYFYHGKISNSLSFENRINEYEVSLYVDVETNSLYYAELVGESNGMKITFIYKPFNNYVTPIVHNLQTKEEEEFNNLSSEEQATGLTEEEITEVIENKDLNGYYFEDNTYSSVADFSRNFKHYMNNELIEEYNVATNVFIYYTTELDDEGNIITVTNTVENYINDEFTGEYNLRDYSDINNVYSYTIKDLYNLSKDSYDKSDYSKATLVGSYINYNDENVTQDQLDFCDAVVKFFNKKSLSQLLEYSISSEYSDVEKCAIYYIADKYRFIIDNGYTLMDLLQLKGFDIDYYSVETYNLSTAYVYSQMENDDTEE